MAEVAPRRPRGCSTICLPIDQQRYQQIIDSPELFRRTLDQLYQHMPELFPKDMAAGYTLKDDRVSRRLGLRLRRIKCKATGASFTVRPSFALPYMVGCTDDVEGPLFLRGFGVPFWALDHVFGKGATYWYRLEASLGRNSIVGTTVRRADVPEHLLADEHHQPRDGEKNYIATTVGSGCCLGACLAQTAGAEDLQASYKVFKAEAEDVQSDYQPKTVSVDGWAATRQAWLVLFPLVVLLRCFLHGWLNIRSRGKLSAVFAALSEKVWHAYGATNRRAFAQRLRRLREWARGQGLTAWLLEQVEKLCGRAPEYGVAYEHPGGHRTSNMLDRVMRSMNRYFDAGQHLHGSQKAGERHCRAWALLHNFRPWGPQARRQNGYRSPAERLNQHRYHDNWLHNLLVSASLAGLRR
jgi:hypothetical protein